MVKFIVDIGSNHNQEIKPAKLFSTSQIKKITGATHSEFLAIPFYYSPPFLDKLRNLITLFKDIKFYSIFGNESSER
jgi:hypothetical protein